MTYGTAVSHLLTVGQELRGVKFDLANITRLLEEIGHPERAWKAVHIAGTNGKGSVAAMVESVLCAAGYRTGLYTSPHLVRVNERMRVAGEEIADNDFASAAETVMAAVERLLAAGRLPGHPSFFECLTAIGFEHFRRAGVEIAVLETGMGGRLDATNVVTPLVSAITLVDFDHEAYLGHTIAQIAFEKAGIIKRGGVVVSAAQRAEAAAVIERVAAEREARLVWAEQAEQGSGAVAGQLPALGLRGRHQRKNAAVAIAVVEELRRLGWNIAPRALQEGLATVRWPGRLEWIDGRPPLLLDGAHNPAGARALRAYLDEAFAGRRLVMVFGAMRDKAVGEIAELLFPRASAAVLTRPRQKRAASTQVLAELTRHLNPRIVEREDTGQALDAACDLAGADGLVVVTGSLYLVGEAKEHARQAACAPACTTAGSGEPKR